MPVFSKAAERAMSAVAGGQSKMSTPEMLCKSGSKSATRRKASEAVLFIFQLPATSGVRAISVLILQSGQAGQHFAFQHFQRSAAAGGDMSDFLSQTGLLQGGDGIAATYD